MSNHEAGHMVSSIIKKILDFYNEGKFSKEVSKDLIETIIHRVLGYDGNLGECVELIEGNYCGRCFKANDRIYNFVQVFWDHSKNELPLKGEEKIIYLNDSSYTFDGFCKECMDEWLEDKFPEIPKEEYYKLMED